MQLRVHFMDLFSEQIDNLKVNRTSHKTKNDDCNKINIQPLNGTAIISLI